jgi:hypothetical protein
MLALVSEELVPAWGRVDLATWSLGEDASLVDALVATPEERALALPAWNAVAWLRFAGRDASARLVRDIEDGSVLLVRRPSRLPAFDMQPLPATDLRDLGDAEPLADEPPPAEPRPEPEPEEELAFIDVIVLDARGEPRGNVAFELVLPDATVFTGRTDPDGRLRLDGLRQTGDCTLTFPEMVAA